MWIVVFARTNKAGDQHAFGARQDCAGRCVVCMLSKAIHRPIAAKRAIRLGGEQQEAVCTGSDGDRARAGIHGEVPSQRIWRIAWSW